jgi:plastocyanin
MLKWLALVGVLAAISGCAPAAPVQSTVSPASPTVAPTESPTATPAPRPQASAVSIDAAEQYFNPEQVTIKVGTTVVWKDVQGTHDMVADDRSFASAVLFEGGTYSHLFDTPGHYRYICTLHVGAGMWAEIDVV